MTPNWGCLPLLPLRCVLDHLSTEDALAAMSTCRHWRDAVLLYEGHKDTLTLRAKNLEASLFVSRIFRRHTRTLHVHLDCTEHELEKFMNFVLTQFFDTAKLRDLIFIGPRYEQEGENESYVKLKRIITESLVFKHVNSLQQLGFLGCEMAPVTNQNDTYTHKHVEYYSRPLTFGDETAADAILSSINCSVMMYCAIQHVIVDYEKISTEAVKTLASLPALEYLSLNIAGSPEQPLQPLEPLDWLRARRPFSRTLHVALNIIAIPSWRFNDIIEHVMVDGLGLTTLRVMFCKTMYAPLLSHATELYHATLREVVWADSPHDSDEPYQRADLNFSLVSTNNYSDANPFVILSWQCMNLRRLVIHGYWVFHYDLLGVVRLSKKLGQLEISSIFNRRDKFENFLEDFAMRVLADDTTCDVDPACLLEVNKYAALKWKPTLAEELQPGLRARSSPGERAQYVLREVTRPLYPMHE